MSPKGRVIPDKPLPKNMFVDGTLQGFYGNYKQSAKAITSEAGERLATVSFVASSKAHVTEKDKVAYNVV